MTASARTRSFRDSKVEVAGRTGLTGAQVEQSRREHGENVLTPPPRDPWWKLFLEKFDDPVIRILLIAASISLGVGIFEGGHYVEAIGILTAVLLATGLAFVNEHRAGKEFDILNQVNDDLPVKVVRDSHIATVPRRAIVVGDLVLLETGDEVPADGEVIETVSLTIDESRLTGESMPVPKHPAEHADGAGADSGSHHAYPPQKALRSTLVADGHGAMLVTAVGDKSEIGHTARAAAEETGEETPLNKQLERLSKLIGVVGFTIAGFTFGGLILRAILSGELAIERDQVGFLIAAGLGLAVGLHRIWIPVIFDALELVGRVAEPPAWLEEGGGKAWGLAVVGGAAIFGAVLGALILLGQVPGSPSHWITVEEGRAFLRFFMIAVVIIVVAVPEGLAMSVTLSLAYSMRKMTAANNLVRRMHACETIGAATVICSDKTGTLTQNRMSLQEAWFPFRDGEAASGPREWLTQTAPGKLLVESVAANSTANLSLEDEKGNPVESPRVVGNPTEGALLLWMDEAGVDYLEQRGTLEVLKQWAFNTQRKFMATAGKAADGRRVLHVKGAPEIVRGHSTTRLGADGQPAPLDDAFVTSVRDGLLTLQARGMRTLGLAYRVLEPSEVLGDDPEQAVHDLCWLGYVGIADPVRPEVPGAIEQCRHAGIDVKIVTGDTPITAQEIARQITLLDADHPGAMLTGTEFNALSDDELLPRLKGLRVLARARPADKLRLVKALQANHEVVAVTGDGTNDAPALNHADVGLAMGKAGTAVAKEAADIVLLDDSFPSIVNAVKWGRSLYLNIQRFVLFQLTINVAACVIAMLGPYIGVEMPLTVMQMLWVNLIMDTFAALALATEPPRDEVMEVPPRDPRSFIITKRMAVQILGTGGLFVAVLVALLKTKFLGSDTAPGAPLSPYELTLFFHFFVMLQFWNLFNARTYGTKHSGLDGVLANKAFVAISLAILLGQAIIVTFGGAVFRTVPLGALDWAKTLGLSSLVLVTGELLRWLRRRSGAAEG